MLSIQDSASKQLNLCSFIGRHTQLFRYFDIIVSQKKKDFLRLFYNNIFKYIFFGFYCFKNFRKVTDYNQSFVVHSTPTKDFVF